MEGRYSDNTVLGSSIGSLNPRKTSGDVAGDVEDDDAIMSEAMMILILISMTCTRASEQANMIRSIAGVIGIHAGGSFMMLCDDCGRSISIDNDSDWR